MCTPFAVANAVVVPAVPYAYVCVDDDEPFNVVIPALAAFAGVKPKAVVTSLEASAADEVTRPLASTVTFVYVPAVTPELERIIVFDAAAIVASPTKLGKRAMANVPEACDDPKSTKFNSANAAKPKLVRATVADTKSDKLFAANKAPTPTAPEAAGT